jgi:hypothetical protein
MGVGGQFCAKYCVKVGIPAGKRRLPSSEELKF